MRVVYFMRRPRPYQNFSVEHIVDGLISNLSPQFEAVRAVSRFPSSGVLRRTYNIFEAPFRQGDVNHVTGDVHFVTYLLDPHKTVLTVLDCGRISGNPDLRTRIVKLLWYSIPAHCCSAITVISSAVKDDLLRHVRVDPEKIHVIPVAVPSLYTSVPKVFNAERPTILQVGTAPNKNLPRLFEALAGISCILRIVGQLTDAHREALRLRGVAYENHVGLTNEQMLQQYSDCDIVSFPSTFEGFGMPIIEGNIVGRPVVCGNVASMPEVAGNAACLVDPTDVRSIRAGFLRVIQDAEYRSSLIEKGYENVKRFEQATIARQYEALYRKIDAQNPSRSWSRFSLPAFRAS